MSSRAGKMEKDVLVQQTQKAQQEVKNIDLRFDVDLVDENEILKKSAYLKITGVPKDLPPELENTVIEQGRKMFAEMINSRIYQEYYNRGKTSDDENPIFYNLSKLKRIEVVGLEKLN